MQSTRYDPVTGIYSLDIPWVPTLTEIMRRQAILDMIDSCKPGTVLEIGCGAGALIHDLARRHYRGKGIDISDRALRVARTIAESNGIDFLFAPEICERDTGSYDYVIAISVLEHIEDDRGAVRQWSRCLKTDGKLIIAVPAHMELWGDNDVKAGHYRRYERSDVTSLLDAEGLITRIIFSYGYPVVSMWKHLGKLMQRVWSRVGARGDARPDMPEATAKSGIDRPLWSRYFFVLTSPFLRPIWRWMFSLQRRFYVSDRGTGYVLMAERGR